MALAAALGLLVGGLSGSAAFADEAAEPVAAEASQSCDKWFPDFTCGRSGRWDGFHMPIVAPFLFEDPFITTGLHGVYIYHEFPGRSVFQGGNLQTTALQARVAITDRVALIATKDGRVWSRPDISLVDDSEGWFNIAGGLKVSVYEDVESQFIVSGILRIEVPSGSSDQFQGWADGMVLPSVSWAKAIDKLFLMGDLGAQIPFDTGQQSTSIFWHLYAGYEVHPRFTPFAQLSGLHWTDSGNGDIDVKLNVGVTLPLDTVQSVLGTGAFEGADVMNLGSKGVSGLDLVTAALGFHVPITDHLTFSAAYERPISHHKGVFKQRGTASMVLEF